MRSKITAPRMGVKRLGRQLWYSFEALRERLQRVRRACKRMFAEVNQELSNQTTLSSIPSEQALASDSQPLLDKDSFPLTN
jgi:hypothetical protein